MMLQEEKKQLTLQETKDIILKWINSCDTSEQLNILALPIERFWLTPFRSTPKNKKTKSELLEYEIVFNEIADAITTKRLLVVRNNPPLSIPTLDAYSPQLNDIID